jgi:hypothetical protein
MYSDIISDLNPFPQYFSASFSASHTLLSGPLKSDGFRWTVRLGSVVDLSGDRGKISDDSVLLTDAINRLNSVDECLTNLKVDTKNKSI